MANYRRAKIAGGTFFFTLTLADRSSDLLVREIDRLRYIYARVQEQRPFETVAICILPDHLHAIWSLPENDFDYAQRWNLIKGGFSRGLPAAARSASQVAKREKGIWQRRYWEHAIRNETILRGTSTTFTSIRSSTGWCREFRIGRTAAFIAMSNAENCSRTGAATFGTCQGLRSANDLVGTALTRLCPRYARRDVSLGAEVCLYDLTKLIYCFIDHSQTCIQVYKWLLVVRFL